MRPRPLLWSGLPGARGAARYHSADWAASFIVAT